MWVVIPKKPIAKSKGIDLSYDGIVDEVLKTDPMDNKTQIFPPKEYGIRFVIRVSRRERKDQQP